MDELVLIKTGGCVTQRKLTYVVGFLIDLITDHVSGGLDAGAWGGVVVLGHVLVGFLGGCRAGSLDGLGDVVGGVPLCCLDVSECSSETERRMFCQGGDEASSFEMEACKVSGVEQ
jgi:hypothetical protein